MDCRLIGVETPSSDSTEFGDPNALASSGVEERIRFSWSEPRREPLFIESWRLKERGLTGDYKNRLWSKFKIIVIVIMVMMMMMMIKIIKIITSRFSPVAWTAYHVDPPAPKIKKIEIS